MLLAIGIRLSGPRSPVRRDGLRRVLRSGWAAAPRKDWELMFVRYSPEVVWEIPEEFQTLGFAESYHGHEGLVEGLELFSEVFESWEIRPARALDFGDRVLALGGFRGKARASGVEWQQKFSQLVTLERAWWSGTASSTRGSRGCEQPASNPKTGPTASVRRRRRDPRPPRSRSQTGRLPGRRARCSRFLLM